MYCTFTKVSFTTVQQTLVVSLSFFNSTSVFSNSFLAYCFTLFLFNLMLFFLFFHSLLLLISAITHMHDQELHLVLSNPPPDTLSCPKPKRQGAEAWPLCCLAFLSAADPPVRLKALWILKHLCTSSQGVKTDLDQCLRGELKLSQLQHWMHLNISCADFSLWE